MSRTHELEYWKSVVSSTFKPSIPILPYIPARREAPARELKDHPTAWEGIENILAELIERFHLNTDRCLEFGVEHGFSTVALSSFFKSVTGVDTFQGDIHTRDFTDLYEQTRSRLSPFDNIHLVRSDYQHYIATDDSMYDLIHVDIVHTYADTLACGLWAARHATCVLFHDTESFAAVKQAVRQIARETGKTFYNYKESNGLGILA